MDMFYPCTSRINIYLISMRFTPQIWHANRTIGLIIILPSLTINSGTILPIFLNLPWTAKLALPASAQNQVNSYYP